LESCCEERRSLDEGVFVDVEGDLAFWGADDDLDDWGGIFAAMGVR
jgi:hypothetical protein